MKPILIDITGLLDWFGRGKVPTGIARVMLAYVQHYCRYSARAVIQHRQHFLVLPIDVSAQFFELLLNSPAKLFFKKRITQICEALYFSHKFFFFKRIWFSIGNKKNTFLLRRQNNLAGSFLFKIDYAGLQHDKHHQLLQRYNIKTLFMVHDLIPITHSEYFKPGERERFATRIHHLLSQAKGVITGSLSTLDKLKIYASENNQPLPPAICVPLASGRVSSMPGTRPILSSYFVVLGTIEPRKNHLLLLQIWRRLVERLGNQAPRLVVIGQRGWECENVLDLLERCELLRGFVIEHSASDAEVVTYLHYAQALLFPSFAEGYGMPLVEALMQGVPVIASDLAVFREVAGDVPEYLDPLDGKGWLEMIVAYTSGDNPLRMAQLERISSFRSPTWLDHFAKVDEFLAQL